MDPNGSTMRAQNAKDTAMKESGRGMGKNFETMQRSFRAIETKTRNNKMTVMKRSKAIRKPQSAKQPRTVKASLQKNPFHCDECNEDFLTG